MVVIIWLLVLQLHMRSVHIITKVVSSIPTQDELYLIQHYVTKFVSFFMAARWFSLGTPVSSTNKTNRHYITEILLKNLALNFITLNPTGIDFPAIFIRYFPETSLSTNSCHISRTIDVVFRVGASSQNRFHIFIRQNNINGAM